VKWAYCRPFTPCPPGVLIRLWLNADSAALEALEESKSNGATLFAAKGLSVSDVFRIMLTHIAQKRRSRLPCLCRKMQLSKP